MTDYGLIDLTVQAERARGKGVAAGFYLELPTKAGILPFVLERTDGRLALARIKPHTVKKCSAIRDGKAVYE